MHFFVSEGSHDSITIETILLSPKVKRNSQGIGASKELTGKSQGSPELLRNSQGTPNQLKISSL